MPSTQQMTELPIDGCELEDLPLNVRRKRRSDLSRSGKHSGGSRFTDGQAPRNAQVAEPALDILAFPENILACILQSLPPEQLLNVSRVSKQFAQVGEVALEQACRAHRWMLPRRPRGASASTLFPWRALYRQHACIACGRPGEFILRMQIDSHFVHLICKRCANVQWVQQRMVRENLFVDLVGISGKKLLSQRDLGRRGTTKGAALLRHYIENV